jgi:hypothetical protein
MRIHWEFCLGVILCIGISAGSWGQTPPTTLPSDTPLPPGVKLMTPAPESPGPGAHEGREGRGEMHIYMPAHNRAMEKAAYLGVRGSPIPAALRAQLNLQKGLGLVVDYVEPGSPAEAAGIKKYDVLQKLDDQILIDSYQLAILIRSYKSGDEIKLTLLQQGQPKVVSAKLVEKEVEVLDENNPWGMPPMPWGRAEGIDQYYHPGEGPHGRPSSRPTSRPSEATKQQNAR